MRRILDVVEEENSLKRLFFHHFSMGGVKLFCLSTLIATSFSFSGLAADKTVAAGETLNNYSASEYENVQVYGTTDKLKLHTYCSEANVHNGGIVNNTSVSYNAKLNVNSGGVANDTTMSDGYFNVNSGGVANDTTMSGGSFTVNSGGMANNTTVNGGKISGLGTFDGLTLGQSARFSFSTDATVKNATQNGQEVSIIDGVATDFVVNSGSTLSVLEGHTANNTTVNSSGYINSSNTNRQYVLYIT